MVQVYTPRLGHKEVSIRVLNIPDSVTDGRCSERRRDRAKRQLLLSHRRHSAWARRDVQYQHEHVHDGGIMILAKGWEALCLDASL